MYILKNDLQQYWTGTEFSDRQRNALRFTDEQKAAAIDGLSAVFGRTVRFVRLRPRTS